MATRCMLKFLRNGKNETKSVRKLDITRKQKTISKLTSRPSTKICFDTWHTGIFPLEEEDKLACS